MSYPYISPAPQTAHEYVRPHGAVSRSPCPALNALANQGYVNRTGIDISFWDMLLAIKHVYNLSFSLAFMLTFLGFLTSGKLSYYSEISKRNSDFPIFRRIMDLVAFPSWTLDLASLSVRGTSKIAHNASLVHPDDMPSTSPDPSLLAELLRLAHSHKRNQGIEGLSLADLGRLHAQREASSLHPLNWLHKQVSLGECGLAWSVLHDQSYAPVSCGSCSKTRRFQDQMQSELQSVIPLSRLRQWFGEERLPDDWWGVVRPRNQIGIFEARGCAGQVAKTIKSLLVKKVV